MVIKVVLPVGDFDVGGVPGEATIGEGENVAGTVGFDYVIITSEEVDILAAGNVTSTFTLPALVRGCCRSLCVDCCSNEGDSESGLHFV